MKFFLLISSSRSRYTVNDERLNFLKKMEREKKTRGRDSDTFAIASVADLSLTSLLQ